MVAGKLYQDKLKGNRIAKTKDCKFNDDAGW
jgi:hypothetical protein